MTSTPCDATTPRPCDASTPRDIAPLPSTSRRPKTKANVRADNRVAVRGYRERRRTEEKERRTECERLRAENETLRLKLATIEAEVKQSALREGSDWTSQIFQLTQKRQQWQWCRWRKRLGVTRKDCTPRRKSIYRKKLRDSLGR